MLFKRKSRSVDVAWDKLKHMGWRITDYILLEHTVFRDLALYCLWLRRASHAAWKRMGAMTDAALAEAWTIQPDLGKNIPIHLEEVNLLGEHVYLASQAFEQHFSAIIIIILAQVCYSTTQSFTCWLIQTSDIFIEWSSLNGRNLYNTERETRREVVLQ